jgi:hypothetical protein
MKRCSSCNSLIDRSASEISGADSDLEENMAGFEEHYDVRELQWISVSIYLLCYSLINSIISTITFDYINQECHVCASTISPKYPRNVLALVPGYMDKIHKYACTYLLWLRQYLWLPIVRPILIVCSLVMCTICQVIWKIYIFIKSNITNRAIVRGIDLIPGHTLTRCTVDADGNQSASNINSA